MTHRCLLPRPRASADVLSGTVTTRVRQGATAATAVVYAEPLEGAAPARPAPAAAIEQKNKTFTPRVLAVPVGTAVTFPNSDGIFHNVFSLSTGNAFDLGLYRSGASKTRTLTAPGVVRIFCNIHPQMSAFVVAVPTPWVAVAEAGGAFRLESAARPLSPDGAVGAGRRGDRGRGGGRNDGRPGAHPGRERLCRRAAHEQVRQAVPARSVQRSERRVRPRSRVSRASGTRAPARRSP